MGELAYNLESFNPAFTAVLLKVQSTIGHSDYVARDLALKNLIQPLGRRVWHAQRPRARSALPIKTRWVSHRLCSDNVSVNHNHTVLES